MGHGDFEVGDKIFPRTNTTSVVGRSSAVIAFAGRAVLLVRERKKPFLLDSLLDIIPFRRSAVPLTA